MNILAKKIGTEDVGQETGRKKSSHCGTPPGGAAIFNNTIQ